MAAAVLAKENQVIRRFMNANAYDSSSAVTPDSAGIRLNGINGNAIRRLVWKNVLVRSGAGAYYLDRNRLAIRRRYMIRTFTAVIAVLAIILLVCLLILQWFNCLWHNINLRKEQCDMKQFEYKTVVFDAKGFFGGRVDHEKMENDLNALGSQGWELVNMTNSNESYGSTRYVITVFKREKQL